MRLPGERLQTGVGGLVLDGGSSRWQLAAQASPVTVNCTLLGPHLRVSARRSPIKEHCMLLHYLLLLSALSTLSSVFQQRSASAPCTQAMVATQASPRGAHQNRLGRGCEVCMINPARIVSQSERAGLSMAGALPRCCSSGRTVAAHTHIPSSRLQGRGVYDDEMVEMAGTITNTL